MLPAHRTDGTPGSFMEKAFRRKRAKIELKHIASREDCIEATAFIQETRIKAVHYYCICTNYRPH